MLSELEQRGVALVDPLESLGKRQQAGLIVEHRGRVLLEPIPARADLAELRLQGIRARDIDRRVLDRPALGQRVEVGAKAVARVLERLERRRITLDGKRCATRKPLREHLHLGLAKPRQARVAESLGERGVRGVGVPKRLLVPPDPEGKIDSTSQKLLEDPITYVEALLRTLGPAELNGKGKGLCTQMRTVFAKYPFWLATNGTV